MHRRKTAKAISIIGGADGPTSVFVAGKFSRENNEKISFRQKRFMNKKNRKLNKLKRRLKNEAMVSHTLEELEEYICRKYGAIAISQNSEKYQRALKNLKSNLVFQFFEDRIPMKHPVFPTDNLTPEGMKEYNDRIQEWFKAAEEVKISDEEYCFHYYEIVVFDGKNKGEILVELELKHELLYLTSCYYSNKKLLYKKMNQIQKDIYFYYGETEENIDKGSERFLILAEAMQSDKKMKKKTRKARWIFYFVFFLLTFGFVKRIQRRNYICKKI